MTEDQDPQDPTKPETRGARIRRQIAAIQAQGGTDDDVEEFLASQGIHATPTKPPREQNIHEQYQSGELQRRIAVANARDRAESEPDEPSYAQKALGGIASFLPKGSAGERLQVYARMGASRLPFLSKYYGGPQSFAKALSDVQEAKESSGAVGKANEVIGTLAQAAALPGGGGMLGTLARAGTLGGLQGFAGSEQEGKSLGERATEAGKQTALNVAGERILGPVLANVPRAVAATGRGIVNTGRALGTAGEALGRKLTGKTVGALSEEFGSAAKEAAQRLYPAGVAEATGKKIPAEMMVALQNEHTLPIVEKLASSTKYKNSQPAEIIQKAYQMLGEKERSITKKLDAGEWSEELSLAREEITNAKTQLLEAGKKFMPSWAKGVGEVGESYGQQRAVTEGTEAAAAAGKGTVHPRKVTSESREAQMRELRQVPPEKRGAVREAMLRRLADETHIFGADLPTLTGALVGGIPGAAATRGVRVGGKLLLGAHRLNPMLDALAGKAAPKAIPAPSASTRELARLLGLTAAEDIGR